MFLHVKCKIKLNTIPLDCGTVVVSNKIGPRNPLGHESLLSYVLEHVRSAVSYFVVFDIMLTMIFFPENLRYCNQFSSNRFCFLNASYDSILP